MTQDLKIYLTNTAAFVLSMSSMDEFLRLLLLIVSIGYTIQRWFIMNDKNKEKNEKNK